LTAWHFYFLQEPFGPVQDDLRAGVIASFLHNAWSSKTLYPSDLFPSLKPDEDPLDRNEMLRNKMMALTVMFGGRI